MNKIDVLDKKSERFRKKIEASDINTMKHSETEGNFNESIGYREDVQKLIEKVLKCEDSERKEIINTLINDYQQTLPAIWNRILNKENHRIYLSVLRDMIKKKRIHELFKSLLHNDYSKLSVYLKDPDPKVRKNVCAVIGELNVEQLVPDLLEAYKLEEQLFVKPSIILAIGSCGNQSHIKDLKRLLNELQLNHNSTDSKHIDNEIDALKKALDGLNPQMKHTFSQFKEPVPMILTTMKELKEVTLHDVQRYFNAKLAEDGVLIYTNEVERVYDIRTFYELLYPISDCDGLIFDSELIANMISKAGIADFLLRCHHGDIPFSFRVEIKTINHKNERTNFAKELAKMIENLSKGSLVNSTTSYEVEIRVVEKNDKCNCYLKLYTYEDKRFTYRKNELPASINPATAAIILKASEKWLKDGASILDPFCGTGTMLIERSKLMKYSKLTGVDIFSKAVQAAKENSRYAKLPYTTFIHKDILAYSNDNRYDEIIANMPFGNRVGTHKDNINLYHEFLKKLPQFLRKGGIALLFTTEKKLIENIIAKSNHLKLVEELITESGGLKPQLFIIKIE